MNEQTMNPWQPMVKPIDLKHIGKLGEECGELSAVVARCIIQGLRECEPVTGKINSEWLEEEIADVLANIELNLQHFKLNRDRVQARMSMKMHNLRIWHNQL